MFSPIISSIDSTSNIQYFHPITKLKESNFIPHEVFATITLLQCFFITTIVFPASLKIQIFAFSSITQLFSIAILLTFYIIEAESTLTHFQKELA